MSRFSSFCLAALCVPITLVAACGSDPVAPSVDGGTFDGTVGSDGRVVCTSDVDCNDGLFCNGREMCAPASTAADVRGCAPGDAPCSGSETCDEATNDCRVTCDDVDGDGHDAPGCGGDDCDDTDATRYPGATELCDADDEDCNDTTPGFVDADMDGAGSVSCCNGTACGSDCDDTNASIRPGIADGPTMNCNGVDDDCDGTIDVGCPCADGERRPCYSGPAGTREMGICVDGVTICAGGMLGAECIDDVLPASEVCNSLDDDCDGMTDEGVVPRFYVDVDADGFGQTAMFIDDRCNPPAGYVAAAGDCDDTLPTVHPGQPDPCNGVDDDCDAMTDEGAPQGTYYRDDDGDGYGATGTAVMACSAPAGFVPASGDCDDTLAGVSPVGVEVCDSAVPAVDENCDTMRNEGCGCVDGTSQPCGGGTPVVGACRAGVQRCIAGLWAGCAGNIDPGTLTETCNGLDDDCDGAIDETLVAASCYADSDSDGYGAGAILTTLCQDAARAAFGLCPVGYTDVAGDCNNAIAAINPVAPESCNGIDDNCAGGIDEGVRNTYYADADGDGYGVAGTTTLACAVPAGHSVVGGDCDDASTAVRPSAPEICNGVDENCTGGVDEGVTRTFFRDADGDGFGVTAMTVQACAMPAGYADRGGDCNDTAGGANINPVASERCDGTIDDDCDMIVDDGCTCVTGATRPCGPAAVGICRGGVNECLGSTWSTTCAGEVTSRAETCNDLDDDCDGMVDDGVTASPCYRDGDGDNYGTGGATVQCREGTRVAYGYCPVGWVNVATDCNDGVTAIRPGATETCNGVDDDCDGTADDGVTAAPCYVDVDGDGRGTGAATTQCRDAARMTFGYCPAGYTNLSGDCNDGNNLVRPGVTDTCNAIDDDCSGTADTGFFCPAGRTRTGSSSFGTCASITGVFTCRNDCAAEIFTPTLPPESCDGLDNDCNGVADEVFACVRSSTGNACVTACGLAGTRTCSTACNYTGAGSTSCRTTNEGPAVPGTCNACDDDADAVVDDGFACRLGQPASACTTACGTGGTRRCLPDCSGLDACRAATETCNGCDDDLDGAADDGFACVQNETRPCTFDSNGGVAGCTGITGTQTCNGTCGAWGTCGRITEVCNYICDDNANGTTNDDRDVAYTNSFVDYGPASSFSSCGTCVTGGALAYNTIRIASAAATWQVGYTWLNTPANIGYGNLVVSPDILLEAPPAGLPGEGYAIILSDNTGALWQATECGVPYTRTGLAIEWRFSPGGGEADTITIRRLTGAGSGTVIGTPTVVPAGTMYAPRLDDATAGTIQHNLSIAYTPDDASTIGSEQHLRVATYYGVTLVDVDLDSLPALFQPNDAIRVGFTAHTTAQTANVYLGNESISGSELGIGRYRICAGY